MIVGLRSVSLGLALVGACGVVEGCSHGHEFGHAAGGEGGAEPSTEPAAGGGGLPATGGSTATAGNGGTTDEAGAGGAAGAENTSCAPGDAEPCYASADGTPYAGTPPVDQTTCRLGERKCQDDATWGACLGAVAPEAADTCDAGNDANCNGTPNEGCTCANGTKRACGSKVGNCKQGEQVCTAMAWGPCVGEVAAAATDSCDTGDDANCNGKVNEGCGCLNGTSKPCGTDTGPCEFGTVICAGGAYPATCTGGVKPAAADACDPGNDANCNGTPNEGCGCTGTGSTPCGLAVGACKKGMQACVNGALGMCMGGVSPTVNDTCLAADAANDTNCNGNFRDGCLDCVATDPPAPCGDMNCGKKTCNGSTGTYNTCAGDNTTLRCNPNAPDNKQVCGASGAWVASACPANSVCRDNGASCKWIDGQPCTATADCATSACTSFYPDADKDGYRAAGSAIVKFCGATKTGYVSAAANLGDDCQGDANVDIHPNANEVCDGIDNDCDLAVDLADDPSIMLASNAKTLGAGQMPQVTAASAAYGYGVAYTSDKTYFLTLSQSNTPQPKNTVDTMVSWSPSIAWDGTKFGIFYKDSGGTDLNFRTATPGGVFAPTPALHVGDPGGSGDEFAVRLPNNTWFMTGSGIYAQANWTYGFTVTDAFTPTDVTVVSSGRYPNVAVSGNQVGLVYVAGDATSNPPHTLEFSIRDAAGATETKHVALRPDSAAARKAVIAPRGAGGFAIMWSESNGVYFQEYTTLGDPVCASPQFKALTTFEPDQMVPTKRGYLAVSGNGNVVQAQEVFTGCTYGFTFTNLGTSGDSNHRAHIAAGTNGFAIVWDDNVNVHSRTLGPNICD